MEYVGFGMLALGLLWVAGFGCFHFRAVGKASAAETWPTAAVRVISSEVGGRNYLDSAAFKSVSDSLSKRAAQGESGWSSVSR